MAGTSPRDWTAGETVTATLMDTEVKDNMGETGVQKVTTSGDTLYATASKTLARLAIGANGAIKHVVSNIPAWLALGTRGKVLRVNDGATALEYVTPLVLSDLSWAYVDAAEAVTGDSTWRDPATPGPAITVTAGAGGVNVVFYNIEILTSTGPTNVGCGIGIGGADPGSNDDTTFRYEPAATVGYKPITGFIHYSGLTPGTAYTYEIMYWGDAGNITPRRRKILGWAV